MTKPAWLRVPKTHAGIFGMMFGAELVSFFIICANLRAVAQGNYFWTAVTDTFLSAQGFALFKLMYDDEKNRSWWAGAGCTLGGTCGSLLSIWATKHLFGA